MPLISLLAGLLSLPAVPAAQTPAAGENRLVLRGQTEALFFYPAPGEQRVSNVRILFLPGDGGWRGMAITIAQTVSSWGYDVYGLDTKRYLEGFTGDTTLKETEVMTDLRQVAALIVRNPGEKVGLLGWSEGAGLCLLAAASEQNREAFSGLIAIGLGESSFLGWRWQDNITYITKKDPDEPMFRTVDYLPKVAPLPLLMIQSRGDEYVSVEEARRLFSTAKEPKRFSLIEAQNHKFEGNQEEFFRVLREGLRWISVAPQ